MYVYSMTIASKSQNGVLCNQGLKLRPNEINVTNMTKVEY